MKSLYRNVLIIAAAVIVVFNVCLSISLYAQNRKVKGSLVELKITLEASQKENSGLQKENSVIQQQLKDKDALLEQASQEKERLEKKISAVNENLSAMKSEHAKLQESLKDKEGALLLLQKENEKLKSDNDAKKAQIKETDPQDNSQKIDAETEAIIQKTGLDKMKPKDFVSDYNGKEQFLQDCSSPLCTKIILNNSGIKYAKSGEWEKAEDAFKDVLSNDPSYKPARLNLGLVYDKIKTKKEAVAYWLKVYNL